MAMYCLRVLDLVQKGKEDMQEDDDACLIVTSFEDMLRVKPSEDASDCMIYRQIFIVSLSIYVYYCVDMCVGQHKSH